MSRRLLLTSFTMVMAVLATSCGGSAFSTGSDASRSTAAVAGNQTPGQALTPSPAVLKELNSDFRLDKGLEKLKSYRTFVTYSLEGKDEQGQIREMSIVMAQETVRGSMDQHIKLSTYSTVTPTISGSVEFYVVGNNTYVYSPNAQVSRRCVRVPPRVSLTVNPATLFNPTEVLGLLDNASLVKSGEVVAGTLADQYNASSNVGNSSPYSTAKGDIWVARDGGYVLKYVGEAIGKTALLGAGSTGNIKWDYSIADAGKFDVIQLPQECPAAAQAVATVVANTPSSTNASKLAEDIPLAANATEMHTDNGITTFKASETLTSSSEYYKKALTAQGWTENLTNSDPSFIRSAYCSTPSYQDGTASLVIPQYMAIYSRGMRTLTVFISAAVAGSNVMFMDSGVQ